MFLFFLKNMFLKVSQQLYKAGIIITVKWEVGPHTFLKIGQGNNSHKLELKSNPICYLAHLFGNQLVISITGNRKFSTNCLKIIQSHTEKHKRNTGSSNVMGISLPSSAFGVGSICRKSSTHMVPRWSPTVPKIFSFFSVNESVYVLEDPSPKCSLIGLTQNLCEFLEPSNMGMEYNH